MTVRTRVPRLLVVGLLLVAGTQVAAGSPAHALRTTFADTAGVAIADPISGTQTTDIDIVDETSADPYPSQIQIVESGAVTDVNLKLNNVEHPHPDDLDVLLVGPTGAQAMVMSDAGGGTALVDADINLDDEAAAPLPDETQIVSGTAYRPADFLPVDILPGPAPTLTGGSALSVFDGTDPSGTWSLYLADDSAGDAGVVDGWELDIDVRSTPYPSTVSVSGLGTRVTDLNLTLGALSHEFTRDVDILLVGPGGQSATVLSDVGTDTPVTGVDLVLDDEALAPLTNLVPVSSGTFRPTNLELGDAFAPPAPTPNGSSALSAFDGTDPNGTWSLYVLDDADRDAGTLGSWSLDIETDATAPTGTVSINGGSAVATSHTVTLDLAAVDPGTPSSGVVAVRLSNDGTTFSAPTAYAAQKSWTLPPGDGAKTVWARFIDASGLESAAVSDTIEIDTTGPRAVQFSPKHRAKGVGTRARVKVVASEGLRGTTINSTTVVLRSPSGKVAARLTYTAATRTITLVPKKPLRHDTKYVVRVRGVRDLQGLAWDQQPAAGVQALRFTFTTS